MSADEQVQHRCHLETEAPREKIRPRTRSVCLCGSKSAWYTLAVFAVEAGTDHMNYAASPFVRSPR
jgi:hypothetical protein